MFILPTLLSKIPLTLEAAYHVSLSLQTLVLDMLSYSLGHIANCFPHNYLSLSLDHLSLFAVHTCLVQMTLHPLPLPLHLNFGLPLLPPTLVSLLSLSISPHSVSECALLLAVCSPLPSSSGVSLFQSFYVISPSSFCLLVSLNVSLGLSYVTVHVK